MFPNAMIHQGEKEKKKFRNWVRGGLAYKYLKEGIEGFADDVVQQEHHRILIAGSHSPGLTCNQCCLRNLQPLHKCVKDPVTDRNKCPWYQPGCNCLYLKKQPCPNKVCDRIMEDILKCHRSTPPTPNWKNTDMQKWCSVQWEIAKCFINAPGYSDKTNAAEINLPGLLHVFVNNIKFQSHLSSSMNRSGIFTKTLQRRNELFHSATMEMDDTQLNECIDEIIAILEDKKELKVRKDAQEAVRKLKQLKQESFVITIHNEAEICREALVYITNKSEEKKQSIRDAKNDIVKKQTKATEAIGDSVKENQSRDAVASVTNESEELKQTIQEAENSIKKKHAEAIRAIENKAQIALQFSLQEFDKHSGTLHERAKRLKSWLAVQEGKLDELDSIRQNRQRQLDYVKEKQVLQKKLVELYQNNYVNTSMSPLKLQENHINIKEIYVAPRMVVEEKPDGSATHHIENSTNKPYIRPLNGYREILQTNSQKHKQIYIVGDVGTGKSTFCKMMIQNWCSAVTDECPISVNNSNCKDTRINESNYMYVDPVSEKESAPLSDEDAFPHSIKNSASVNDNVSTAYNHKHFVRNNNSYSIPVGHNNSGYFNDNHYNPMSDEDYIPVSHKDFDLTTSGSSRNDPNSFNDTDPAPYSNNKLPSFIVSDCALVIDNDFTSININDFASVSKNGEHSGYDSSLSENSDDAMYDSSDSDDFGTMSDFEYRNDFGHDQFTAVNGKDINEMRKFDFLFFVPLQKMSGLSDITEMVKTIITTAGLASNGFIGRIFEEESERCLIVTDGLDEWTPPNNRCVLPHISYGLPNRDRAKHATVVTLSRPSAKGILNLKFSECDQKVKLLGIDNRAVKCFIKNYMFKEIGLSATAFLEKIEAAKLEHLEDTPLLLQQLVWLYCAGNEIGKSVSDTYIHIINIILDWSKGKEEGDEIGEDQMCLTKHNKDMQLPGVLHKFPRFEENAYFLFPLARVAFEALASKKGSTTFGRSYLRQIGVPKESITTLLKFGILVENNCFDPTHEQTKLEFIHKTYREFFAAVYVSSHYNENQFTVLRKTVLQDLFQKCISADDVLLLSNVLEMICGLSPFLIYEISKLISDIVSGDESMINYRNSLREYWCRHDHESYQIQRLVFNCLSEGDSEGHQLVSLCDVIIGCETKMSFLRSIKPENVLSLRVVDISDEEIWRWIARLTQLQYMYIGYNRLPHSVMDLLPPLIEEAPLNYLGFYSVCCTYSDCQGHEIDLSKHDQLQKLELRDCKRVIIPYINTNHLEKVRLDSSNASHIDLLLNSSCLVELEFGGTIVDYGIYNRHENSVVHTLQKLRKLRLAWVHFADRALTVIPGMRNIEYIELKDVRMNLQTWRAFVDSLFTLRQCVQVNTGGLICVWIHEDKRNYVRRNTIMFKVLKDGSHIFSFRTKK